MKIFVLELNLRLEFARYFGRNACAIGLPLVSNFS